MRPDYDVILALPAPFCDHPSFPEGLLARALEAAGFRVGVIEKPDWQDPASFAVLGRPRLFFGIVSGPVDSVVLNYTSSGKRRREDLYQVNGDPFFPGKPPSVSSLIRPDRALVVFAAKIRESLGAVPLVIGGVEASLRIFAHWDFQKRAIRRPILLDSRADLAVLGMGEIQIVKIAEAAARGLEIASLELPGTAGVRRELPSEALLLPSLERVSADPGLLLEQYRIQEKARQTGRPLAQEVAGRYLVAQPAQVYRPEDLNLIYGRPYSRNLGWPPAEAPPTPALEMTRFSLTTHRGCAGGCAFCSIAAHQGRGVVSRDRDSILNEIKAMRRHPAWRGVVSDLGGASAEMWQADCYECDRPSCLDPSPCPKYPARAARDWQALLGELRRLSGIKKIGLGSGVRFEVFLENPALLKELLTHHAGRFLRVAPEHTEDHVLKLMRKPPHRVFLDFVRLFNQVAAGLKRPIRLAPYIIVGHPGESFEDLVRMRDKLDALGLLGDCDVQIFTPSPGSLATAYYTAQADLEGNPLAVATETGELIKRQRLLIPEARYPGREASSKTQTGTRSPGQRTTRRSRPRR